MTQTSRPDDPHRPAPREGQAGESRLGRLRLGEPRELAPGVWTVTAEPASVTIGVVSGTDGTLVIDTGSAPGQGAAIRTLAAEVSGRPVTAAVVTHHHVDHAFGLAAFADLPTYGHETLVQTIPGSTAAGAAAAEFGFDEAELAVPNRALVVAAAVDLGGRRVEIAHLGRGHTSGDLLVVVPDADLVFAGDLIEQADAPWFGEDSVPAEWAATLDGLIGLLTEHSRAVPGHGDVVDREFVFNQRGQIAAVAGEIARFGSLGVDADRAAEEGSWPFDVEHIRAALPEALRAARPTTGGRRLPMA